MHYLLSSRGFASMQPKQSGGLPTAWDLFGFVQLKLFFGCLEQTDSCSMGEMKSGDASKRKKTIFANVQEHHPGVELSHGSWSKAEPGNWDWSQWRVALSEWQQRWQQFGTSLPTSSSSSTILEPVETGEWHSQSGHREPTPLSPTSIFSPVHFFRKLEVIDLFEFAT